MKGDFSRQTFGAPKHYAKVLMQQGRVQLDSDWNEQQSILEHRVTTESKDVVGASGAPQHTAGFGITTADGKTLTIGRGRYYVDGILCENEADAPYLGQPDFPSATDVIVQLTAAQATAAIIYLDVWRRHLTALDDPLIRETALGGPDTSSRVKTVWQVKALPAKTAGGGGVSCDDSLPDWDNLVAPSTGLLSARAQPTQATDSPCLLPPGAGYRSLDNRLYRVEVHQGGALGTATFKWSRDNGIAVSAIESVNGQDVTVHQFSQDDVLAFAGNQWVELTDDVQELSGQPGQFLQIDHVNAATRVVSLKTAPAAANFARNPKLRRWDNAGLMTVAAPATNSGFIPLENGVEVKFEAGNYKTGDYWFIPARVATGSIEWPFASPQPPLGIVHHYSRLAVATLAGNTLTLQDCRVFFAALADAPPAVHVNGISWINDDVVTQDLIQTIGLLVNFDGPVTPPPTDGTSGVVVVNLEMPLVVKPAVSVGDMVTAQFSAILNGDMSFPTASSLLWKPATAGAELKSLLAYLVSQQITRVRVRYTLRGRALWLEQGNDRIYVDGQALGQRGLRADGTPRIDLQLPSGDRRRASDFESWFYIQLQLPPSNLVGLSFAATKVLAGASLNGTVVLDNPAPAPNGVQVKLTSSATQATVTPATLQVPPGQTQAQFSIATNGTGLGGSITVVITASAGNATQTNQFTLQIISITISPNALTLYTGHTQPFTAVVTGGDQTVTWSVQEAGGGSVTTSGFYTAPTTQGTFHVVATSTEDPSKQASATVRIEHKPKEATKDVEKTHIDALPSAGGPIAQPGVDEAPSAFAAPFVGRAFIRPDERPPMSPSGNGARS